MNNHIIITKTPESADPKDYERCSKCNGVWWVLDKSHYDLHGYGFRCAKCNNFLAWAGKGNKGRKNQRFKAKHQKEGELICEFCGITESEAKKMGHHFTMDHKLAEEFGGLDEFKNSRPLCSACHYLKTAVEHRTRGIRKLLNENH